MNNKVLIQTLTQIPDLDLLKELQQNLRTSGSFIVPDLKKLFNMFTSLLKFHKKPIIFKTLLLIEKIAASLMPTELQILWREVGAEIVSLGGVQDEEIRKKGQSALFNLLGLSNNSLMVLQTLYYSGLQNENSLVTASSISYLLKVFEQYHTLLQKKSSIAIIKLILQKIIRLTFKDHQHLNTYALFYLNFANMHEVLQRMDSSYLKALQKIWEKDKEQLLYKQTSQEEEKLKSIQYEHLPIIKQKIFGIYQPFVIKNLFAAQTKAAKRYAVQQFKKQFMQNQEVVSKYVNLVSKIIVKILPDKHIQILQLLSHILNMPGIANIINLRPLLDVLLPQLADPFVPYRKNVRQCLKRLNCTAKNVLVVYNQALNQIDRNNEQYDWILVYELLQIVTHWIEITQPADCYPPALNDALIFAFNKRKTKVPKIKQKCGDFLFGLLQKYPSYRQTLEDILTPQQMGELQDEIEQRKNFAKLNHEHNKLAKQTFLQEYRQERNRYMHKNN